ncbi:hypothetical protein DU000_06845 [Parvibium lacunae]|uniref:Blue (type 1) copper domain-containing protein n=2 Tax=Parvibium lacunae TaxID=1888893 RepID=A0A368L5C2_9BURK|nr:hypothetical protein DU000_06845 [Parvibium lacunae]
MVAFVLGTWLDHQHGEENARSLFQQILIGALFSIGLGFFTGGLQHFPDSPGRSLWVVPLGFTVSIFALAQIQQIRWQRRAWLYAVLASAVVLAGSYATYRVYAGHADDHSHSLIGEPGQAANVTHTMSMDMNDTMRFSHDDIEVTQGDTIRFVIRNTGKLPHEFVLGTREELAAHAKEMAEHAAQGHAMPHDEPNMLSVAPGETKTLIWQFTQPGVVDFACLIAGHFEAGMKGRVVVRANPALQASGGHSHGGHSH